MGTGELLGLGEVGECVKGDFVVLPCDLVCELEGSKVVQQWMTLNPLFTSPPTGNARRKGGLAVFYPTHGLDGISTKHDETDFLATVPLPAPPTPPPSGSLRSHIEQIVTVMPTDTLNDKISDDAGFLRLRQSLLERHGRVKMRTRHRDAHVYVFPKWVADFAAKGEGLESLSEDVLGWWAKAGWQGGLAEKVGLGDVLGNMKKMSEGVDGNANGMDDEDEDPIDLVSLSSTKVSSRPAQPSHTPFASRVSALTHSPPPSTKAQISIPPLLAYIQPPPPLTNQTPQTQPQTQPLIRRIDTTPQLLSLSLHLARKNPSPSDPLAPEYKIHPTATLDQQARVSSEDSLVGENVKLGFRCNVKESVIGANCEVGRNVRLLRCLLMEGVVVGEGVVMSGCVLGRRARVEGVKAGGGGGLSERQKGKKAVSAVRGDGDGDAEARTKLTDCEIAPSFVVEAGTEARGEKLMGFDTTSADETDEGEDE